MSRRMDREGCASPERCIVFLDFDGVLNDATHRDVALASQPFVPRWSYDLGVALIDPARVARVQRVCDATGAAVVLVTGWRTWAPVDDLARILEHHGLTAPVLGAVASKMSCDMRAWGTGRWLDAHPEVTAWVVIDDTAREWPDCARLVSPVDGITDEDAARAVAVLRGEREGG